MKKKGKLQRQETSLLSGKSKTTFAMGVAGSSSDENDSFCSSYGQSYYQDLKKDKKGWIGSENPGCSHWFHFECAMLDEMP